MRPIVEKILLEEPEDTLPAVEITEPITVTDTEIAQPEVSPEIEEDAFVNLITTEISNNYTAIDSLKSIKVTLDASTLDEDKKASVNKIIEDIIDNRTLEIGMFQTALEQLNPEMSSTIEDGEELAVSGTEDIVLDKEDKHLKESSKYGSPKKLLKQCGEFVYHATYKSELDNIYKEGLHDFWFGIDDYECLDMIEYNHDKNDEEVIIAIPTKYLDVDKCDFTVDSGDGWSDEWAGTGIYEGTITKDKFKYIYDVDSNNYIQEPPEPVIKKQPQPNEALKELMK